MPRLLYVFPHPDDESFGPAPAIARQVRAGHEAFLLTLTRGEATSERQKHGFSKEEMGRARYEEMQRVAEMLGLAGLTVLDFPDGGLSGLDPRVLEDAVARQIEKVKPAVVVTYAAHGVSGHADHLVSHAVVKRVFCAAREAEGGPRRLALFTLPEDGSADRPAHLTGSPAEAIGCVVRFSEEDRARAERALACYATYQDVVAEHEPLKHVAEGVPFELFQERFRPPLGDLFERLP